MNRSLAKIKTPLALGLVSAWLFAIPAGAAINKTLTFALATEPPQLDASKATDQQSFFVLGHIMEGLTRNGKDGKTAPGVAEKWEINDQGATFTLRKNAKWADGKPVTAKDFVFSWKLALDPKNASEYAFILYPIKGAEAINKGTAQPDTLGAKAIDDHTLKVEFEKPTGYFLALTSFATYFPIREDFYKAQNGKYGADAANILANGGFKLTSWVHGASLTMEKNASYWNAAQIQLDKIEIPYITPDPSARFNFFKDNKIDVLEALSKDTLPLAQKEKYKVQSFGDGSVFFMEFNFREGKPTRNLNLRKAIQNLFKPDEYVSKVIGIPGTKPGRTLIPAWVNGAKDLFRKEYPYAPYKQNLVEAKKYAELAKKELGGTLPPLVWLTGDTPASAREAEYFQALFKSALGIDLRIDKQIFKQRLAKMSAGEFDIVSAGWGPDYADAMTFADLMTSWNENNRGRYNNPQVDAAIREAQSTTNAKKRVDAMAKAEKIVLEDLAILPLFERTITWLRNDRVEGILRRPVGADPDFNYARITK